jgi:hypothetical protein
MKNSQVVRVWVVSSILFGIIYMLAWPSGVMACDPDCGDCKKWDEESESCVWSDPSYNCAADLDCGPDCGDCISCRCQDDDTECGACEACLGATCDFLCDDPLPVCDEEHEQCVECVENEDCGAGPGHVCCDYECCESLWCCGDSCCDASEVCCGGDTCCDLEKCCGGTCCGADQYCCGSVICDANEVCCYDVLTGEHSCEMPCTDEVVDTTTCAEDHAGGYECPGCVPAPLGTGCAEHIFTEYSGLDISECYDGCLLDHTTTEAICYVERRCVDSPIEDALCLLFGNGELGCVPDDTPVVFCSECECTGPVVYTYTRETCTCN